MGAWVQGYQTAHPTHWLIMSASFSGRLSLPRKVSSTCCMSREGGRVGRETEGPSAASATSSLHKKAKALH